MQGQNLPCLFHKRIVIERRIIGRSLPPTQVPWKGGRRHAGVGMSGRFPRAATNIAFSLNIFYCPIEAIHDCNTWLRSEA